MDLAKRIAAWRKLRGLSHEELADAVGVTVAAVYQWEGSGKTKTAPSHENLAKIAKAFGLTMSKFWGPITERRAS